MVPRGIFPLFAKLNKMQYKTEQLQMGYKIFAFW